MGHRQTDGARKWTYFYLYVILDVFNRRVVEGRIADAETAALFKPLFDDAVVKSHSRPHTSNDNPVSESCFKPLKYQPQFPKRFGCFEDAKVFCRQFFDWFNQDHHHAGIGLMTPNQARYGQVDAVHAARRKLLDQAFAANPERSVANPPKRPRKPTAVWINPPVQKLELQGDFRA